MSTVTNSVPATTDAPVNAGRQLTIREQLRSPALLQQISMVVPKHMKPERMVRVALTAITRTPELAHCDQASFFRCLMDLSQWGLEPDGRHAHLIPFRNSKRNCVECQLIIDYKGLVQLAYRSGFVRSVHADIVRTGDLFVYNRGEIEQHTPWFLRTDAAKPNEAGELFAAYCRVELKDGAVKTEAMSRADIDGIRSRSKAGRSGPWVTDYAEMAKKTAFRRVSKWIPLSAEIVEATDRDDDRFEESHTSVVASKDLDALAARLMGGKSDAANTVDAGDGIDPPHDDEDAMQDQPSGSPSQMTAEELADQEQEQQQELPKRGKQKSAFDAGAPGYHESGA